MEFVEVQGTGEETTFTRKELNGLLDLAEKGIKELFEMQNEAIAKA
jgi:ribonuclease PH